VGKNKSKPKAKAAASRVKTKVKAAPMNKKKSVAPKPGSAPMAKKPGVAPIASRAPLVPQGRKASFADSFTTVIGVLMRDVQFGNLKLRDIENLVLPAMLTGQYRVAYASVPQTKGPNAGKVLAAPAGVVMWANLSAAIDKRISQDPTKPIKIGTNEWRSGDIPWVMVVAGDRRVMSPFLKQFYATQFKGKTIKTRYYGKDGVAAIAERKIP
jgi:hemolysin-activating ACP:hemolysin acyltransferase